jgi:hypothetical protein
MEEWIKKALKDLLPTLLIIIILWIAIILLISFDHFPFFLFCLQERDEFFIWKWLKGG